MATPEVLICQRQADHRIHTAKDRILFARKSLALAMRRIEKTMPGHVSAVKLSHALTTIGEAEVKIGEALDALAAAAAVGGGKKAAPPAGGQRA